MLPLSSLSLFCLSLRFLSSSLCLFHFCKTTLIWIDQSSSRRIYQKTRERWRESKEEKSNFLGTRGLNSSSSTSFLPCGFFFLFIPFCFFLLAPLDFIAFFLFSFSTISSSSYSFLLFTFLYTFGLVTSSLNLQPQFVTVTEFDGRKKRVTKEWLSLFPLSHSKYSHSMNIPLEFQLTTIASLLFALFPLFFLVSFLSLSFSLCQEDSHPLFLLSRRFSSSPYEATCCILYLFRTKDQTDQLLPRFVTLIIIIISGWFFSSFFVAR